MYTFTIYKLSLSIAFTESHKFRYVVFSFSSVSRCFPILPVTFPFTHLLFKSLLLLIHHIFLEFSVFSVQLLSAFIWLWLKKILHMTLVFLNLLGLVLWPSIWPVLENIPSSIFRSFDSLLIFHLVVLFIIKSGILKSLTVILSHFISPFYYICFLYLEALRFNAYICTVVISSWWIDLFNII